MRTDKEIIKNQNFHRDSLGNLYLKPHLNGRDVMVTWSRCKAAHCEVVSVSPMDGSELTQEEIEYIKGVFFTEDEECKRIYPDEKENSIPNAVHLFHYTGRK